MAIVALLKLQYVGPVVGGSAVQLALAVLLDTNYVGRTIFL